MHTAVLKYYSVLPTLEEDNTDGIHGIHQWVPPGNHRGVPPAFPPPGLALSG